MYYIMFKDYYYYYYYYYYYLTNTLMHSDKNIFIIYYLPFVYLLACYTNIIIFFHAQIWNI